MFIPIESILKGHGVEKGAGDLTGFYETRYITGANGRRFVLPTDHCNPKRDAMVVFLNGTYQQPGVDYEVKDDEVIEFVKSIVSSELTVMSFKNVTAKTPLLDGGVVEEGSVTIKKLSPSIQATLTDPVKMAEVEERIDEAVDGLDQATRELAFVELFWAAKERTYGGTIFGDDFRTPPINMLIDETSSTFAQAVNSGNNTATLANASGFYQGLEVTLYDNASFERKKIATVSGNTVTFDSSLTQSFKRGTVIARSMAKRNETQGRIDLATWTDPVDGRVYEVSKHDIRARLPVNDRFVTWVKATGATVDGARAYPTLYRPYASLTTNGGSHFSWTNVGNASVTFDVTTAGGAVGEVFVRLKGRRLSTLAAGAGTKSYTYPLAELEYGRNDLEFVAMNGTTERVGVIRVDKIGDESFVTMHKSVLRDETQLTANLESETDALLRITLTRTNAGDRPVLTRIVGAYETA